MNTFHSNKAMTLVEILVAVFVLTVGIVGSMMFLAQSMTATQGAKDVTIATTHAETILEEMKNRLTLGAIEQSDWAKWIKDHGLDTLNQERIDIHFENPGQKPLKITVAVNWMHGKRPQKIELYTEMAK